MLLMYGASARSYAVGHFPSGAGWAWKIPRPITGPNSTFEPAATATASPLSTRASVRGGPFVFIVSTRIPPGTPRTTRRSRFLNPSTAAIMTKGVICAV